MKIAIIGAGFTGLTAGLRLLEKGQSVEIFDQSDKVGGLAAGFSMPGWDWPLEFHYHHIFETDKHIRKLAQEIGQEVRFYDVTTASLFDEMKYFRLDSPVELLRLREIGIKDRLRMGAVLGYLKYAANWKSLDKHLAGDWLRKTMGNTGYEKVWKPLMAGKFGEHQEEVNAAWFWARIKARSKRLGYFEGGFMSMANKLAEKVRNEGGKINLQFTIDSLQRVDDGWVVNKEKFDKVIVASTANVLTKLVPNLPEDYKNKIVGLKGLGTVNLVLRLKEGLLPNNIYWLSVHTKGWPMLAIVEHTNMINKSHYNGEHLVYVAKYLKASDPYMKMDDKSLLEAYTPYLTKIKPGWRTKLNGYFVFRAPFTQPVMTPGMARNIPSFETGLPNLYLAGMQQVYPWDRGTNFAVELGERLAWYL